MANYFLAPQAQVDITEILEYIAADNVDASVALYERFHYVFRLLATSPRGGRMREELGPGLRSHPQSSYTIFYRIVGRDIEIARVLHTARDIESIFGPHSDP